MARSIELLLGGAGLEHENVVRGVEPSTLVGWPRRSSSWSLRFGGVAFAKLVLDRIERFCERRRVKTRGDEALTLAHTILGRFRQNLQKLVRLGRIDSKGIDER